MSIEFISPVYDRTLDDVAYAYNNQDIIDEDFKGAITYLSLNRIASNLLYLQQELDKEGYYTQIDIIDDWVENDDRFTWANINILRTNIDKMYRIFTAIPNSTTISYTQFLDYLQVNNWERLECETTKLISNMKNTYQYSNMPVSGDGTSHSFSLKYTLVTE